MHTTGRWPPGTQAERGVPPQVLSDDSKRQMYDQYGHAGLANDGGGGRGGGMGGMGGFGQRGPMSAEDMFDVFEQAFGGAGGPFGRRGPARGRDVQVEVQLDLFESASGVKRKVSWRSPSSGKAQEVEVDASCLPHSGPTHTHPNSITPTSPSCPRATRV